MPYRAKCYFGCLLINVNLFDLWICEFVDLFYDVDIDLFTLSLVFQIVSSTLDILCRAIMIQIEYLKKIQSVNYIRYAFQGKMLL